MQRAIIIGCGNQALRWCTWVTPPAPCRYHHLQDYHCHFHCHQNYHFILQWAILILCGNHNLKWRTPAASLPSSSYPLLYNHYLNYHCPLSLSLSFSSSLPPLSSGRDRFEVYWGRSRTLEVNIVRYNALPQLLNKYKQGNDSLRRPPKLIIQKIFNKQKWATVYRFMCNRICKSKCLVFQRHFDILFHNLSKINLDVFIRLFHLHWTFKCNWKSLNVDKKQTMTLWPRHNGLWSGRSEEVRPKGPADAPSNTRWLHGRAP